MTTTPESMRSGATAATFRTVFESELPFVCRALRRLGVREADLGDVAQELFLTVHDRLADYDPSRPIRTWLHGFCLRFASNYRRLARHRGKDLPDEPPASDRSDAAATRDLVMRALERLDFEKRTTLVLHDMEGLSAPEIAELTKVPLNTVYSRLRLARADFREAIDALNAGGGAA